MKTTVAFGAVVVSVIAFATAARSAEYDPGSPTYAAIAAAVKERVRVARPWTVNVSAATVEDDYAIVGWIAGPETPAVKASCTASGHRETGAGRSS